MSIAHEHQIEHFETKSSMPVNNIGEQTSGDRTLELVDRLCNALSREKISYCHWKSNAALDRSASGDNDLDLLVKRSDIQHFREILFRLGFKQCLAHKIKQLPGVQDFFGYDPRADKFIHVHGHYQLILGYDLTKNYHLPIEKPYLESAQQSGLFKIPAPEFELVIFVIRMVIKHSTWDMILIREGALSRTEKQELVYLEAKTDPAIVAVILKQHLPFIDEELFDDCLQALHPDCPLMSRIRAGQRLQNRLKVYARRSQMEDLFLKSWRRISLIFQYFVLKQRSRYRLGNGGAVVAIVGGDGAGKTTVVDELSTWLSRYFDTIKLHMGKPSWSITTIGVRGLLKIGNILRLYPFEETPVQYGEDHNAFRFPGFPWLIRQVCTARDRFLTFKRGRRFASNGGILICDRYPVQQIRFMESPYASIQMTNRVKNRWLVKFLIRAETKYYQQILLPELLIVLRLDPAIAVQRKQDEDEFQVRARSTEIWEFDWKETPAHIIDASQPKDAVLSTIKSLVWSEL